MKTRSEQQAEWEANRTPTTKPDVTVKNDPTGRGATSKRHPAFGMIRFSRIQGGMPKMFGSELRANSCIRMTVERGVEEWSLHEKRYFSDNKPLIEVDLTAAQFAELLTSMNVGSGIPCTINRTETDWKIPHIADEEDGIHHLIKQDLKDDVAGIHDILKKLTTDLTAALSESGLNKTKRESLLSQVSKLSVEINSNMPFVLDQYLEAAEKIQASAKAEIDAFATNAAMQLGVKRLQDLAAIVNAETQGKLQ